MFINHLILKHSVYAYCASVTALSYSFNFQLTKPLIQNRYSPFQSEDCTFQLQIKDLKTKANTINLYPYKIRHTSMINEDVSPKCSIVCVCPLVCSMVTPSLCKILTHNLTARTPECLHSHRSGGQNAQF